MLDTTSGGGDTGDSSWHRLAGTVEQGYRITSMTLSATVDGKLFVQSLPCDLCTSTDAAASNGASLAWAVTQHGQRVDLPGSALENVIAPTQLALTSAQQIDGAFGLDLTVANTALAQQGFQSGYVNGQWYWERYLEAASDITVSDLTLTVQVTAVPEPSTYAMLLAGLCVAGWAARRRKA
ncbi:PEP-CTERM sorting domain-containing protein [Massilia buxea]|nr:PEP-CTERM sorting domain-containing protein [Pseudoduganella buxea]